MLFTKMEYNLLVCYLLAVLSIICFTFIFILFEPLGDLPELDAIKIGPLPINWRQVKIGLTSHCSP